MDLVIAVVGICVASVDAELLAVSLAVGVNESLMSSVLDAVADGDGMALVLSVSDGVALVLSVSDGVALLLAVGDGVALSLHVLETVTGDDADTAALHEDEAVTWGVADVLPVSDEIGDGVPDDVGVNVKEADDALLGLELALPERLFEALTEDDTVLAGVPVSDLVAEFVEVINAEAAAVLVPVTDTSPVPLFVLLYVGVTLSLADEERKGLHVTV
jgi:hypothetical protein